MGMDGTFVDRLIAHAAKPHVVKVNGIEHLTVDVDGKGWVRDPDLATPEPLATPVELSTLTGFVDYVKANRDQLVLGEVLVHVVDHAHVLLCSPLRGEFRQREVLVRASCAPIIGETFRFGQYIEHEAFLIALRTLFVESEPRETLLGMLSSIKDGSVREFEDSGAVQEVTARSGAALRASVKVPNPVTLAPYRTFGEVLQPASPFVLRLKSGDEKPAAALFEADGGQWKLDAIWAIASYLREELGAEVAVVA
jgi:hypothetical protein